MFITACKMIKNKTKTKMKFLIQIRQIKGNKVKTLDTHQSEVNELKTKRVKKSIYSISSDAVC